MKINDPGPNWYCSQYQGRLTDLSDLIWRSTDTLWRVWRACRKCLVLLPSPLLFCLVLSANLTAGYEHTCTITDGVFSHIWSYKEHGHNDLTICKIKYMAKELKMYSTNWYIFCPCKTMLRYWNWQKEIDLVFSHFCHARVTEKSCRHQPKLLISDQTTVLPKWTRHAEFELIPDFVTPSPFV